MDSSKRPTTSSARPTVPATAVAPIEPTVTAHPLPVPGPSPESEAAKRSELRKWKFIATGMLVVATLIYLGCRWYEVQFVPAGESTPWQVRYLRAGAEAGMVGALADWFAVTALFRHPMGIPIPHTAIVRRKKDDVGNSLAQFVGDNFLNPTLIVDKVRKAEVPERIGHWLAVPENAAKVSQQVGKFTANALEAIDPADAEAVLKVAVIDEMAKPEWGPPAGRVLEQLIDEGRTEPIVQQISEWMHRKAQTAHPIIDRMVGERAPSWAPAFVNDLIGDRVHRELVDWTWHVQSDPNHEARVAVHAFLAKLATDLQDDPTTMQKVEDLKADLLSSSAVQKAPATIWRSTSAKLIETSRNPDSLIRKKISESAQNYGQQICEDAELRRRIGDRLERIVVFFAENYAGEITSIISETVERWDADETSNKIELMVGKDLQYIRLNGTIVGALAGMLIYGLSELFFAAM